LIELFKLMKGPSSTPWSHFFKKAEDTSTRGHTWKLVKKHCHCHSRLYFFSQRVINRWNKLSQEDVDAQSINCFKNRLEKRCVVYGRWTSLKTNSLLVPSAAKKDKQELLHQHWTSMPGAAAPGKYPVNNTFINQVFWLSCNCRVSVGLSQHFSGISSLIVANCLFHYIIQNFQQFLSFSRKFRRHDVRHLPRSMDAPGVDPWAGRMVWVSL